MKKSLLNAHYDNDRELSEEISIQGLSYIFSATTRPLGKLFWLLSVLLMFGLGILWSLQMYNGWDDQQVLTTIRTIGRPIKGIEFPSVTFCSNSNNEIITNASMIRKFYQFIGEKYGYEAEVAPVIIAELINKQVRQFLKHKKYLNLRI